MLWFCQYRNRSSVPASELRQRFLSQHDAGSNRPGDMRGWYSFATGTEGVVLIETDDPRALTEMLQPYSDLLDWSVQCAYEINYNQLFEEMRYSQQKSVEGDMMAGLPPASATT